MASRYDVDPRRLQGKPDILEFIAGAYKRIEAGETVQRAGFTAIEDGDFVVRNGDIIVSETEGNVVFRLLHGTTPEMRFFPIGIADTHRISFFAKNDDFFGETLFISVETNPGAVVDGGKVILSNTMTILSYQPLASGGNEAYLWFAADPSNPEAISVQGKWFNALQGSSLDGIYTGQDSLGAGFSSYTHTYFVAFATTPVPIVTLFNSGGVVSWILTAQSTSSYTVSWSGTTAKTINWWVFRI